MILHALALILRCEICICFLKRSLSLGASTARCWLPTSSQIAARPTLMKAPTNQPHRQKIPGLFLVRFICRFSFGTPVVTTATHHALTLFVERRICVTISCFRRGGSRETEQKNHQRGIHAQDCFGTRCGRIRARGSTIEPGCSDGRAIGSKKHAELS
jgi:hypothetical protein